jgi:hypothetical protein
MYQAYHFQEGFLAMQLCTVAGRMVQVYTNRARARNPGDNNH